MGGRAHAARAPRSRAGRAIGAAALILLAAPSAPRAGESLAVARPPRSAAAPAAPRRSAWLAPGRQPRPGRHAGALRREEAGQEGWIANGFYRANIFVVILLATEIISGVSATSGPTRQSYMGMVPVLLSTSAVLRVMRNAAVRRRLNETTFRVLALSLAAAFSAMFYHISFQLWRLLFGLPGPLRNLPIYPVFIATIAMAASFFSVRTAYRVLQEEGLPNLKRPQLRNILAAGYAVTFLHQVLWGAGLLLYSNLKTAGALRCFVLAACAYVCQGAAALGTKRLSSDVYQTLNAVVSIDSAARLASAILAAETRWSAASMAALPAVALGSSVGGWIMGRLTKPSLR